ncbi:hypothetical protein KC329_g3 [Hortaea werneckii]|nr:hypothetical protein KC329_g3 [Hortaea werneckii]
MVPKPLQGLSLVILIVGVLGSMGSSFALTSNSSAPANPMSSSADVGGGSGSSSANFLAGCGRSRCSHGKMGGGAASFRGCSLGTSYHMSLGGSGYCAGKLLASGFEAAGGAARVASHSMLGAENFLCCAVDSGRTSPWSTASAASVGSVIGSSVVPSGASGGGAGPVELIGRCNRVAPACCRILMRRYVEVLIIDCPPSPEEFLVPTRYTFGTSPFLPRLVRPDEMYQVDFAFEVPIRGLVLVAPARCAVVCEAQPFPRTMFELSPANAMVRRPQYSPSSGLSTMTPVLNISGQPISGAAAKVSGPSNSSSGALNATTSLSKYTTFRNCVSRHRFILLKV